jgi:hypothetical protein
MFHCIDIFNYLKSSLNVQIFVSADQILAFFKFWLFSRKSNNFSQTGIRALKPLGTLLSKGQRSQSNDLRPKNNPGTILVRRE